MKNKTDSLRFYKIVIIFIICVLFTSSPALASRKERIISLTPASTEILFALGLDKEIIGVSTYCSWPLRARSKEKVGSFSNPNIEKIILLKPDLVVLTGMEQEYLKYILSTLDIEYITVDPSNLKELVLSIDKIGAVTGREKEAKAIAGNINDTILKIKKEVSNIPQEKRPGVYLEIWHDPIMSPGGKSFVSDMIESAGGKNITRDLKRSYSKIDPEAVILRDPDIIILTYMKPSEWVRQSFAKRIGWQGIKALKNGMIFADIDPDIILRPGPRVKEGLIELHKRFYEN